MDRVPAIAVALTLFASSAAAWNGPVHERVARLAVRLMPPSLAEQLERNEDALVRSATAPHGLPPSDGDPDRAIAEAIGEAVRELRSRASFAEVAASLGSISRLVADATFPLHASASDPREATYYKDFTHYADTKLERFRPVFNGYVDFSAGFDPAEYVRNLSAAANRRYPFVSAGYYPEGAIEMRPSSRFDDRGPIFGVTQLAFVDAVTATANVWLYVWRQARGDLSDTPFYSKASERSSGGANSPRAAQRP